MFTRAKYFAQCDPGDRPCIVLNVEFGKADMSVSSFEIDLERASGVYYAGEVVRGTVKLVTTKDIKTRGVRVRYQGLGHMHFHTGSGDNRNDYDGLKVYEEQRYTMFGNYFNTSILYEAGEDANFGSASGDGTMYIPCNENDRLEMIVRVMDFDFGKKDDLLGEIVLNVTDLAAKGNTETFSLQRKGKPEKGNVTLSAKIFPMHALFPASPSNAQGPVSGYSAICELRAHRATGLRKADFIGKNDVYVQAYRVPNSTVDQNKVLPEPDRTTTLPAGTLVFPFAFPIRVDAPGSAEMRVCDWAFIRYNLYANIDIAWWKDPSVKRTITVIASRPLPPPKLLYPIEYKCLEPVLMSTCCCFPWCTRVGSVTLDARLGRQVFASGERLDFSALLHNSTSQQLTVSVEVVCRVFMQTTGMVSKLFRRNFCCCNGDQDSKLLTILFYCCDSFPTGNTLRWCMGCSVNRWRRVMTGGSTALTERCDCLRCSPVSSEPKAWPPRRGIPCSSPTSW